MNNNVIFIGGLVMLVLGAAIVLRLRTFFTTVVSYAEVSDPVDVSWRGHLYKRLLDPADFDYLRSRGIGEVKLRKLRVERRRIFRLYMRSLARDFNRVQHAIKIMLVQAQDDRPDIAAELAKQRVTFYCNLLKAEAWLALNACGFDRMPAIDLSQPLQNMQAQFLQLAPAHQLAGA